ncbi:MAG: hypothetical protein HYR60_17620 [Acidobacteria bacterium]|nr:hypothetical protein [Acidobacteriota bacterium]
MGRVLLALAVVIALIGGCAPCSALAAKELSSKKCCNPKGDCEKPVPTAPSHQNCRAQTVDWNSVDKADPGAPVSALCEAPVLLAAVIGLVPEAFVHPSAEYSPPGLYLRNSSLRI